MSDRSSLSDLSPEELNALQHQLRTSSKSTSASSQRPIRPRQKDGPAPLSRAQQRVWFREQLQMEGTGQHTLIPLRIRGAINPDRLVNAISVILDRHEVLRTRVVERDGHPKQQPCPAKNRIDRVDLTDYRPDVQTAQAQRTARTLAQDAFDLTDGSLLRGMLIRKAEDEHVLLLVIHHFAFDHASMGVFLAELGAAYKAAGQAEAALDTLPIQYADYAAWEHEGHQKGAFDAQIESWVDALDGVPFDLPLPVDHPERASSRGGWSTCTVDIPSPDLATVQAFSRAQNVTGPTILFAAFQVLVHVLTGANTFAIGYPLANRSRSVTQALIGPFSNDVLIRADVEASDGFEGIVRTVHERLLHAQDNADVPIQDVVQALEIQRTRGSHRLTSLAFNVMKERHRELSLPDVEVDILNEYGGLAQESGSHDAPVHVHFGLVESADKAQIVVGYDDGLFDASTIETWVEAYLMLLRQGLEQPNAAVETLAVPEALRTAADAPTLNSPSILDGPSKAEFIPPETPIETMMADLWSALLDGTEVGRDSDFFLLGGHSLLATVLTSRIRDAFGVQISLLDVFESPTLRELSIVVEEELIAGMEEDVREQGVEAVKAMEDDEVRREMDEVRRELDEESRRTP